MFSMPCKPCFRLCIRDSLEIIQCRWQHLVTGRDILERRRPLTRKRCAWTQATIPAGTSTGFLRFDIQIPDDARDLDRDVQAYYRELRTRRRRRRVLRLAGPLTRHGMIMPLVAACLAVTLLTGTLLTVLSGRQVPLLSGRAPMARAPQARESQARAPRTPSSTASQTPSGPAPSPASGGGRELPAAGVLVGGTLVGLRSLAPGVLTWVPPSCSAACEAVLRKLASKTAAAATDVTIYFVGTGRAVRELPSLAGQAGLGQNVDVVDSADALAVYHPVGVTAIFARPGGSVGFRDVVRNLDSAKGQGSQVQKFDARLNVLISRISGAS